MELKMKWKFVTSHYEILCWRLALYSKLNELHIAAVSCSSVSRLFIADADNTETTFSLVLGWNAAAAAAVAILA